MMFPEMETEDTGEYFPPECRRCNRTVETRGDLCSRCEFDEKADHGFDRYKERMEES